MPLIFAQVGESNGSVFVPLQTGKSPTIHKQHTPASFFFGEVIFSFIPPVLFFLAVNQGCPAAVLDVVQKRLLPALDLRKPGKKSHKYEKYNINCVPLCGPPAHLPSFC